MHTTLDKQDQLSSAVDYIFDNVGKAAKMRHSQLSTLYDAQTVRHLEQRGITNGWSCLEVGGGGGSIASWLCARVGDRGRVLATDIEPRFLQTLSFTNLEVCCHDIRSEELPEHQFDLAHARLVLIHLPERELALERMLAALRPGGWIVIEEFDLASLLPDPAVNRGEESLKALRALYQVLVAGGVEARYGSRLAHQLRTRGLVNVGAEASMSMWTGRSAGTSLFKLNVEEVSETILGSGLMSQAELRADLKRFDEQNFFMLSPTMWTAWGQVPSGHRRSAETLWSLL